jgi:hypothetical protein
VHISDFGMTVTNQNFIQEGIKRRSNFGRIYKTIILLVILYGCETWSLTLREEHILRVFENRMLRRIFGPKTDEVTEGLRKLHNEELCNLYSLLSIIRMMKSMKMRWAGHIGRMGRRGYWWESQKETTRKPKM